MGKARRNLYPAGLAPELLHVCDLGNKGFLVKVVIGIDELVRIELLDVHVRALNNARFVQRFDEVRPILLGVFTEPSVLAGAGAHTEQNDERAFRDGPCRSGRIRHGYRTKNR